MLHAMPEKRRREKREERREKRSEKREEKRSEKREERREESREERREKREERRAENTYIYMYHIWQSDASQGVAKQSREHKQSRSQQSIAANMQHSYENVPSAIVCRYLHKIADGFHPQKIADKGPLGWSVLGRPWRDLGAPTSIFQRSWLQASTFQKT